MKITRVHSELVTMPLETPYQIAYDSIDFVKNAYLKIYTDSGYVGLGCAAPDVHVTGEHVSEVCDVLGGPVAEELKGRDPLRSAMLLKRVGKVAPRWPSACAAVDMALYDILGKVAGLPLFKMLGGYRNSIRTSMTIGILNEKETLEVAADFVKQGFLALKIKGGLDVEEDIVRVIKLREIIGKKVSIRFDANQGYSVDQAIRFVTETRSARVEILEQPTPKRQPDLLGQVARNVPVPVMADESLLGLRDAFKLARRDWIDMVNIKLMKVGGIAEAMAVTSVARAAKLEVMIGCMDEMALGIAAGLHFALARPGVEYADLDGHIGLRDDPTAGCVVLRNGVLYSTGKPGLGLQETG